ncbi:hypothetical protein V492_02225 [Pseudogymnoascus sp. VKM F-4246]|nr:hypothetical protein V492_02225 [Pseudogymnoascus sp. VKM F-4246]
MYKYAAIDQDHGSISSSPSVHFLTASQRHKIPSKITKPTQQQQTGTASKLTFLPTMPAGYTFGIELEYLVPFLYTGDPDPEPNDRRTIDRAVQGENAFCDDYGIVIDNAIYDRVRSTLRFVGLPAAKMPDLPAGALPSQWDVVVDESLVETDEMEAMYGEGNFIPVELNSPVLLVERASFRSIRLAVDALVSKHRLFITDTCGFHVHVGRGKEGFPLPALKNIAAFLWVFEPQLGTLHPKDRHLNGYGSPMRERGNIKRLLPDVRQGVREIYAASTARKLVHLIHWTDQYERLENDEVFVRNMAYNFVNIVHKQGKKTIEFRQAASTTDSLDVKMWAEICTGIVAACAEKPVPEWKEFLLDAAAKEERKAPDVMKIAELLRMIGLSDQATWAQQRSKKLWPATCSIQ